MYIWTQKSVFGCEIIKNANQSAQSTVYLYEQNFMSFVDERSSVAEMMALQNEQLAFAHDFVCSLPPTERELAYLVYSEDMLLGDVAKVIGKPLGTVFQGSSLRRLLCVQSVSL